LELTGTRGTSYSDHGAQCAQAPTDLSDRCASLRSWAAGCMRPRCVRPSACAGCAAGGFRIRA